MTLLRRQPRAVYRVCDEDEYLAGVDPFADRDVSPQPAEPASHLTELCVPAAAAAPTTTTTATAGAATAGISRERRLRRLAGVAALTGAVGAVGGTIALVGLRPHAIERQIAVNISPPQARIAPTGAHGDAGAGAAGIARVAASANVLHGGAVRRDGRRRDVARPAGVRREVAHRVSPTERSPRVVARRPRLASPRPRSGSRSGAGVASVSSGAHVSQPGSPAPEIQPARYAPEPEASIPQDAPVPVASTSQDAPAEAESRPRAQSEFGFER